MGDEGRAVNSGDVPRGEAAQPRVGVGVLLVDRHGDPQGRVLLTLRKFAPEAGCWSIVGGKLDFLEPLEDCAIREAFEEVSLTIAIDSLLCVTDHILPAEGQHWVRRLIWAACWVAKPGTASRRKRKRCNGFGLTNFRRNSP
jgi:ADP-ribose pyrophosphatase YjhB (NUDIX family)